MGWKCDDNSPLVLPSENPTQESVPLNNSSGNLNLGENQLDVPVEDADDSSLQDIVELIIDDSPQAIPSDRTGIPFENDSSSLKDADELFYCGDISSTLGQPLKPTICEDVCSNSLNQPQIDSENITHKILNKNDESETPSVLIFHNNIPEQTNKQTKEKKRKKKKKEKRKTDRKI